MTGGRQKKERRRIWLKALWLVPAVLLVVGTETLQVHAQDQASSQASSQAQTQAQPARAIRLSFVDGKVSLAQDGQELAVEATANTPLFQGSELKTGEDGRAEIQFEEGSVARLAPSTALTLTTLNGAGPSGDAEITVLSGLAYFELQQTNESGIMRIHFGNAQVTASGFTVLRVNMDKPPGGLAVLSGNARVERGQALVDLHGGESIALDASSATGYEVSESVEPDTWDSWNSDRDQALNSEASQGTEADSKVGGGSSNPAWSALDANGNWYNVPGEGYVWSPYDASNPYFDPYGYGNWMWMPGYGYIWVSGYEWGYLPYQCGLWNFYTGFGWGWAPGIGGCSPWWGLGFYPGPVLGVVPVGYRPVRRPPIPVHVPPPGRRIIAEKRPAVAFAHNLPVRTRSTPVQIAGNSVRALPMLVARPQYNRSTGVVSPTAQPRYLTAPKSTFVPVQPESTTRSAPAVVAPRPLSPWTPPATTGPRSASPTTTAPHTNTSTPNHGTSSGSSSTRSSGASSAARSAGTSTISRGGRTK